MYEAVDELRDDEPLRALLQRYRERASQNPGAEWQDRVMEQEALDAKQLSGLHGLLIANGWLETRVCAEAFSTPGMVRDCYRPTRAGLSALDRADNPFFASAEGMEANGWSEPESPMQSEVDHPAAFDSDDAPAEPSRRDES